MSDQDRELRRISRRDMLKWGASMAVAASLAACAPTAAPAPDEPEPEEPEEVEPEAPAEEEVVELRLTFWGDIADMPTWQWGLEQWADVEPNIKIKWENTPWGEYWTKLQTEMAGGTPPDVVGMVSMYSQHYIRTGTLLPLDDYISAEAEEVDVDDFWPAIMTAYRWEGKTYCFPYDLSTMCIFYNKALLDEAGVPYPVGDWTWDQFSDACQKLTKDTTGDGKTDQFGYLLPDFGWTFDVPLGTNNTSITNSEGTKCLLGTPEAIETTQWLSDLRNVHGVAPTIGQAGDIPMWETGKAAFTWGNPEYVQVQVSRVGPPRDNDKFLWDLAYYPMKQRNANALHGGSFGVGNDTEYEDQSWKFVKFYTSSEILREMVAAPSRGISGRRSSADAMVTDENPEHQQYFLDALDIEGMECRAIVPYQEVMDIMNKYLDRVFLDEATAAEAMPQAVAEIDPILEKYA